MRRLVIMLIAGLAVTAQAAPPTINGHAVSVAWRAGGWNYEGVGRGAIVKMTIRNGAVTRCDTLHRKASGLAQYPTLNFTGTKVAFYRWQQQTIGTGETFGSNASTTISVVNIDGTGLQDLATLPAAPGAEPIMDWPAGDWIYYKKPVAGGSALDRDVPDIWRVNVVDPTLNHRVLYYQGFWSDSHLLRRWSLSADGQYSFAQYMTMNGHGNQNVFSLFPPRIGDYAPSSSTLNGSIPGCNASISASGTYGAWYFGGVHPDVYFEKWDHATNTHSDMGQRVHVNDIAAWTGQPIGLGGELIRWAANSDKWVLQQIGWYGHAGSIEKGAQQVAANWKDRQAIILSGNVKLPDGTAPTYGNCPGDLWIDGGASAAGKYEDVNGTWIPVAPVGMYAKIDWTGTNPYTVTLSSAPSGGDLYYTTDGSTPTQSSTRYTAPFSLTAPSGRTTCLKVRAFKTGVPESQVVSKLFVPQNKALPTGYIPELLCLENATGTMLINSADTSAVLDKYAGEHKAIPFDGDAITANGRTYTWHLRADADGIWEPTGTVYMNFIFYYTNIIAPTLSFDADGGTANMVTAACRFNNDPLIYSNGWQVVDFDAGGHDGGNEWNLDRFVLDKGANGLFVKMRSGSRFALKLPTSLALSYYPYAGSVNSVDRAATAPARPWTTAVRLHRGSLSIDIAASGAQTVTLARVNGRVVRTWQGSGPSTLETAVQPGVYLVKTSDAAGESVQRVLVR